MTFTSLGAICAPHQTPQFTSSCQRCPANHYCVRHSGKICRVVVQVSNQVLEDYLTSGGSELLPLHWCDVHPTASQLLGTWSKTDFILAMQRAWKFLDYTKSAQWDVRATWAGKSEQAQFHSSFALQYCPEDCCSSHTLGPACSTVQHIES